MPPENATLSHHSFACSNSLAHDVLSSWKSSQQTVTSPEVTASLKRPTSCGQPQGGTRVTYLQERYSQSISHLSCMCAHLRPTPRDPRDCSPPDSSVQGILQARILECIVMPSSLGHLPYTGIKPASSINFFLVWYKTALFKNHTLLLFFFLPQEWNSFVQVFHIFHRNSNSLQDSTLLFHPHYKLLFHSK